MKVLWAGVAAVALAAASPSPAATKSEAGAQPSAQADSLELLRVLGQQCRSVLEGSSGVRVDETMARFNMKIAEYPFAQATADDLNAGIAAIRDLPADSRTVLLARYQTCVYEARLKQLAAAPAGGVGSDRIIKRSGTTGADAIKSGLGTAEQWERDRPAREAAARAAEASYQAALVQLQADRDRAEAKEARDQERAARGGSFDWGAVALAVLGAANTYVQAQAVASAPQYSAPSMSSAPSDPDGYSESPGYSSAQPSVAHNPANEASSCIAAIDANSFAAQGVSSSMGAVFRNRCPYPVEVTWCVNGSDCNPGYSNLATVPASSDRGISYDASQPGSINFAACRNGFTRAQSELSRSMQHACN